ncbi:hypothetical protein DFJ73DRAFT_86136 [Zopfochytrium polystomum]|nr:hypothetical protein DFJ73DRAFT_86136 [Zopfochytrium polystomum]
MRKSSLLSTSQQQRWLRTFLPSRWDPLCSGNMQKHWDFDLVGRRVSHEGECGSSCLRFCVVLVLKGLLVREKIKRKKKSNNKFADDEISTRSRELSLDTGRTTWVTGYTERQGDRRPRRISAKERDDGARIPRALPDLERIRPVHSQYHQQQQQYGASPVAIAPISQQSFFNRPPSHTAQSPRSPYHTTTFPHQSRPGHLQGPQLVPPSQMHQAPPRSCSRTTFLRLPRVHGYRFGGPEQSDGRHGGGGESTPAELAAVGPGSAAVGRVRGWTAGVQNALGPGKVPAAAAAAPGFGSAAAAYAAARRTSAV